MSYKTIRFPFCRPKDDLYVSWNICYDLHSNNKIKGIEDFAEVDKRYFQEIQKTFKKHGYTIKNLRFDEDQYITMEIEEKQLMLLLLSGKVDRITILS